MKIGLTKYGWPQVVIFPVAQIVAMVVVLLVWPESWPIWGFALVEVLLAAELLFILCFFRDPKRAIPTEKNILLAPADGKIADIETIENVDFIEGSVVRIGIFLSVFNVHINRAPCDVRVEAIEYKKGKFKDARNSQAGKVNEANALLLVRKESPKDRLIVRQISGAIARRIVCKVNEGQELSGGEKFGMIKFGSRTELYLPAGEYVNLEVEVGDKVKAGVTILARYK